VAEEAGEEAPQGEGRCGGDGRPAGTPPSRAVAVVGVVAVPPLLPLVTADTYVYNVALSKTCSPQTILSQKKTYAQRQAVSHLTGPCAPDYTFIKTWLLPPLTRPRHVALCRGVTVDAQAEHTTYGETPPFLSLHAHVRPTNSGKQD